MWELKLGLALEPMRMEHELELLELREQYQGQGGVRGGQGFRGEARRGEEVEHRIFKAVKLPCLTPRWQTPVHARLYKPQIVQPKECP